ncbi:MAG: Sporulation kinase A [Pelotomaculum sp. PtaB.Bin104]|nr:MAG: Sporulation kinase A [Pelotomaculum sp. PtaB.Bin104]
MDDRPENLLALEAILISSGYNLFQALSGEDALKYILEENFALILMDVQMPGLNGFETAKLIRQRKKSQNIPIVFITAINQANEYVIQGYQLGATDYIIKPVHPDTLRLKVQGYVKNYKARETLEGLVRERTAELISANKKLVAANKKINDIIESITDGFIALDHSRRFTYVNKEASRIFEQSPEKLIGRHITEVVPEKEHPGLYQKIREAARDYKPVHLEVEMPDSTFYDVNAYAYPEGLSICFRDITEGKHLKEEMAHLDRLDLIGQMAAGIGHEIRNPMTTVRGFLQLMSKKEEFVKHKDYFALMIEELDRANFIITEFLSLARKNAADLAKKNINTIIEAIYPLIQANAMENEKYSETFLNEVPDLMLDEKEIRQLILNLARNGLEAMSRGGKLTIKTVADRGEVVLAVQDQGKGIAPEILDQIGTPFFTTKDYGTGLGLSVCHSIATRHNAKIDIDTGPAGSTFSVRFKYIDSNAANVAPVGNENYTSE